MFILNLNKLSFLTFISDKQIGVIIILKLRRIRALKKKI